MVEEKHAGEIAGSAWNPSQYLKYGDLRLRPALELLDRVPLCSPGGVWDLGCGTGEVTRLIAGRWPDAQVHGLDNSPDMLRRAKEGAGGKPDPIRWVEGTVEAWDPDGPVDLAYSNATLHWVDRHREIFPRLAGFVRPGGCLAVQMPLSWDLPSHRLMRETLAVGGPGGRPLGGAELRGAVGRRWVDHTAAYYDLLCGPSRSVDIWETEYVQVLEGEDPVLEWVKGTGLRPILNDLVGEERELFLREYARRLREEYPAGADGRTLYPFRRLFMVVLFP